MNAPLPRFFKMPLSSLKKQPGPGGARLGAGRKAGGQNNGTQDRKLMCAWLCDWFGRQLSGRLKRPASDADCEQSVNNCFSDDKRVFESEKSTLGGMWAKARRAERPFASGRLTAVVTAADKLKFWDPRWRRDLAKTSGESDHLSLLLLSLIAVEGADGQKSEKFEFAEQKKALQRSVDRLAKADLLQFGKRRSAAVTAFQAWSEFVQGLVAGHVGVRPDLASSIESGVDDERRWVLHPARTIKRLSNLKFDTKHDVLFKASWQVWALYYRAANFSESTMLLNHLRKRKTGTKLAQLAQQMS